MKVAVFQGPSPEGDINKAMAVVERAVCAVAHAGAKMIVFPELFLPGYNQADRHSTMAQAQSGPWYDTLSHITKKHKCGLTIGWAERDGDEIFNAVSCFDETGKKVLHYRKIQLFGPIEKSTFDVGDTYQMFSLGGTKAAVLICYDVEFAHHVQALRDLGVEVLLVPTANPIQYNNVPEFIVPARAAETGMTIVYANYTGTEKDITYGGRSLIVGPNGAPLAKAGDGEVLLIANLNDAKAIDPSLLSTQSQDKRVLT